MQSYAREGYSSAPPTFTIYDDDGLRAPNIRPPFPPDVTAGDLAELALSKNKLGKPAKPANAFIAYRTVFHRYLKDSGRYLTMPRVSSMSKLAWHEEDDRVKSYYKSLSRDAKNIYIMRLASEQSAVTMKRSDSSSTIATDFTPDINSSSIHHSPFIQHGDELAIYSSTEESILTGNIMPLVGEIIRRDELCIHDGGTSDGMQVDEATTQGTNMIGNIIIDQAHMDSINVPHDIPQDISQNMVHGMSHDMPHDMAQDMAHNMAHDIAHDIAHDMTQEMTQGILQSSISSHNNYQGQSFYLIQPHLQASHDQPIYLTDDNLRDPAVLALISRIDQLERVNDIVMQQLVYGYGPQG
ncbi:6620_t:CDS:2 [Paraglomus brasilianum]|uniref:6620_t:CDS:1 n=1 Tax=Paraglomus brasilianum TaxID=144538 RepID=A0A9N8Z7A6_9GLOM|nr:6620_t:CDS:2 [Paraglomus brasilianum]